MIVRCSRVLTRALPGATTRARFYSSSTPLSGEAARFSDHTDGILRFHLTNDCNSVSSISTRGPGFRLPAAQNFCPLPSDSEPSANEIVEAVERAYEDGQEAPNDIVFDNVLGEPTMKMDTLLEAAAKIKERRHGVPLTVKTNGLCGADGAALLATADPGDNFGLKNLHVNVLLMAHNPPDYVKMMAPKEPFSQGAAGFGQVCSFVVTLVEQLGSDYVTCTAVDGPGVDLRATKALSSSLGAGHFEALPFVGNDFYSVLGIDSNGCNTSVTVEEIKGAYTELAKELHPDKHGGVSEDELEKLEKRFAEVTMAYKTLSGKTSRVAYDLSSAESLLGKTSR